MATTAAGMDWAALPNLLQPLLDTAAHLSGSFVRIGMGLLAAAVVLEVFVLTLRYWLQGGLTELLAKGLRMLFVTAICFAALTAWGKATGYITQFFQSDLAAAAGYGGAGIASIGNAMNGLVNAASNLAEAFSGKSEGQDSAPSQQQAYQSVSDKVGRALFSWLAWIIVGFCLLILLASVLFSLYGPLLLLAVGIIMGPVLIVWLTWEPMENFPMRWLKYMLSMGAAFVVGLVMVHIMTQTLNILAQGVAKVMADPNSGELAGALPALVSAAAAMLFMAFLFMKADDIGAALVGGPGVGGGGVFAGMAVRRMMQTMRAAGRSAVSGGRAAASKALGRSPGSDAAALSRQAAEVSRSAGGAAADAGGRSKWDKAREIAGAVASSPTVRSAVKWGAMGAAAWAGPVAVAGVMVGIAASRLGGGAVVRGAIGAAGAVARAGVRVARAAIARKRQ